MNNIFQRTISLVLFKKNGGATPMKLIFLINVQEVALKQITINLTPGLLINCQRSTRSRRHNKSQGLQARR